MLIASRMCPTSLRAQRVPSATSIDSFWLDLMPEARSSAYPHLIHGCFPVWARAFLVDVMASFASVVDVSS